MLASRPVPKCLPTVPAEGTLLGAVRSRGVAVEEPDAWKSLGHEGQQQPPRHVPRLRRSALCRSRAHRRCSQRARRPRGRGSPRTIGLCSTSIGEQVGFAVNNARLAQQARHAASLEERRRLARDMHDSISQSLYSLTLLGRGRFAQGGVGRPRVCQGNRSSACATRQMKRSARCGCSAIRASASRPESGRARARVAAATRRRGTPPRDLGVPQR